MRRAKICRECDKGRKSEKNYCKTGIIQDPVKKYCKFFEKKRRG